MRINPSNNPIKRAIIYNILDEIIQYKQHAYRNYVTFNLSPQIYLTCIKEIKESLKHHIRYQFFSMKMGRK